MQNNDWVSLVSARTIVFIALAVIVVDGWRSLHAKV